MFAPHNGNLLFEFHESNLQWWRALYTKEKKFLYTQCKFEDLPNVFRHMFTASKRISAQYNDYGPYFPVDFALDKYADKYSNPQNPARLVFVNKPQFVYQQLVPLQKVCEEMNKVKMLMFTNNQFIEMFDIHREMCEAFAMHSELWTSKLELLSTFRGPKRAERLDNIDKSFADHNSFHKHEDYGRIPQDSSLHPQHVPKRKERDHDDRVSGESRGQKRSRLDRGQVVIDTYEEDCLQAYEELERSFNELKEKHRLQLLENDRLEHENKKLKEALGNLGY